MGDFFISGGAGGLRSIGVRGLDSVGYGNAAVWESIGGLWRLIGRSFGTIANALTGVTTWTLANTAESSVASATSGVLTALTAGNATEYNAGTNTAFSLVRTFTRPEGSWRVVYRLAQGATVMANGNIIRAGLSRQGAGFVDLGLQLYMSGATWDLIELHGGGFSTVTAGSSAQASLGYWCEIIVDPATGNYSLAYQLGGATTPDDSAWVRVVTGTDTAFTAPTANAWTLGFGFADLVAHAYHGVVEMQSESLLAMRNGTPGYDYPNGTGYASNATGANTIPLVAPTDTGGAGAVGIAALRTQLQSAVVGSAASLRFALLRGATAGDVGPPAFGATSWGAAGALVETGSGAYVALWMDAASTGSLQQARFNPQGITITFAE